MISHTQMDKLFSVLFIQAGILVMACSRFGSCLPDSSLHSEMQNVRVDVHSTTANKCVLPSQEKWVLKSYFAKYGTLQDSNFQNFKEYELTPCACKVLKDNPGNALKVLGLERHLIGEGSHRRLLTSISMDMQDGSKDQLLIESCEVIIIERLPSGVFADPFELQHLHELRGYGDVAVFGDTNLELPSFLSNRSAVEIHMDLGSKKASRLNNGLEIDIEIPLHARYPAISGNGYSSVEFEECDVFIRCSPEFNLPNSPCLSILTTTATNKPSNGPLVWEIPSGIEAHAGLVSIFTFLSAALASITVVVSSLFCSGKQSRNLKQL